MSTRVVIIAIAIFFVVSITAGLFFVNRDKLPHQVAIPDASGTLSRPVADNGLRSDVLCDEYPYQNEIPGNIESISDSQLVIAVNLDRIFDNPCVSMPARIVFGLTPDTELVKRVSKNAEIYRKELETHRKRLEEYKKEHPDDAYASTKVAAPSPYENEVITVDKLKKGFGVLIYVSDEDHSVAKRVVVEFSHENSM